MAKQIIEIVTVMSDKLSGKAEVMTRKIQEMGKGVTKTTTSIKQYDKGILKANKSTATFTKGLTRFKMEFLGILFFGMAIKRLFDSIARSAITSFTKIIESNNMMGTAVQRLSTHWEFLKFSIGSALNTALEPLLPKLIEIIDKISEWTQKHPKLTSGIILTAILVGTLLLLIGTLALGMGSLALVFPVATASMVAFGTAIKLDVLIPLGKLLFKFALLAIKVGLIIGLFLLLGVFLGSLFGGFNEDLDEWARNAQVNGGIIAKVLFGLVRLFNFAGEFFRVAFLNVFDTIALAFQGLINIILSGVNLVIKALNSVAGTSIPLTAKVDFGAKERIVGRTQDLISQTPSFGELFNPQARPSIEAESPQGGNNVDIRVENNFELPEGTDPEAVRALIQEENAKIEDAIRRYT